MNEVDGLIEDTPEGSLTPSPYDDSANKWPL